MVKRSRGRSATTILMEGESKKVATSGSKLSDKPCASIILLSLL